MSTPNETASKLDVYSIVTNRIIELLEAGTIPWQKPWTEAGMPMNLISKRPYKGINLWLLLSLDYKHNLFLTWDQLKKIGGSVRQGEHGHVVIYWKTNKKNDNQEGDEKKSNAILRYYKVFNIAQCRDLPEGLVEKTNDLPDGLDELPVQKETDPIAECEAIIQGMPQLPIIKHKEQMAYYDIAKDYINMPRKKSFKNSESYYAVLFHELVHSTGSEKRLNRKSIREMAEFGDDLYSIEELIAELGSAYLYSFAGIAIPLIQNSAAYIQGWLDKLKNDKRFMVQASSQAQKSVDFILNNQPASSNAKDEIEQSEVLGEL